MVVKNVYCNVKFTGRLVFYALSVFPVINMIVISFLPVSVIIVCNVFVIVGIIKASRRRQDMSVSTESDQTRQMSLALVGVSLASFVTTMPIQVFSVLLFYTDLINIHDPTFHSIFVTLDMLLYCNNAVNFFIYCLIGSNFRSNLSNMFKSCWNKIFDHIGLLG